MLKTTVFLFALAFAFVLSSVSMADATCPKNTTKVMVCKPAPKAGDHEVAISMFDSISVCQMNQTSFLLNLEKNGEQSADQAKVDIRAGGISYTLTSEDVSTTLSVATGILSKTAHATLDIELKNAGLKVSATYSCQR